MRCPGLLLAIDTATAWSGVALFDGSLRAELNWNAGLNHTRELLPAMTWLLSQQSLSCGDIAAISVNTGPGSFNGLRVGISTAKGLAFANHMPCFGVGTFEATSYQYAVVERSIRPVYDAGRGEVATALYGTKDGEWRQLEEPRITTLLALAGRIDRPTLVCGELRPEWAEQLVTRAGSLISFPSGSGRARRAGYLAELAWRRWQDGEAGDLSSVQPVYLRPPAITLPKM